MDNNNNSSSTQDPSRRKFLKNSGYVAGGVVGGGFLVSLLGNPFKSEKETFTGEKADNFTEARMFFTRDIDFNVLSAATERIYPEDDNGPGAIELRAPYYIDKQLAGQWGINAKEYTKGPFTSDAPPEQGYQSSMVRSEVFLIGIRKINEVSNSEFEGNYHDLEEKQQNEILTNFENDDVEIQGIRSSMFFSLLREATLEGVYSDPLYGGNKNMGGWKMKEFPGPYPAYIDDIDSEEFLKIDPVSLMDQQKIKNLGGS